MIILNAICPIFLLLLLGHLLKRFRITDDSFLKTADKLVYFIFFPVMLFWKIGKSGPDSAGSLGLCLAGILAVALVCGLSIAAIETLGISRFKAGSFSQACYRFNTYIGMAVVMNVLGEAGVRYFGILVGFAIPIINVMAVSILIWYSNRKESSGAHARRLFKALVSNPLILGCLAGILFSRAGFDFPLFMENTFSLMTSVTMPLALISIGGSLTLDGLKNNLGVSALAAGLKIIVLPVAGYFLLKAFQVSGVPFKAGMIFFTLPTSTALYVLSAQLNSDTQTASAAIMLSTLVSFFSLSAVLLIF